MGYLMKEALKSLCGVNQWSYAVFWKIGCQNPKLLIWEECYCEALPCSILAGNARIQNQELTFEALQGCLVSPDGCGFQAGAQVGQRVHMLIDKMMMTYQVHVLGEGLVGRAAFSGNHQWIVSGNYKEEAQPPEVQNEVQLQFSAGMQTIAVIPVIPHGVVQFGSSLSIMESIGFVREVKSLVLQLSCVPSTLLPDACITKESIKNIGQPVASARSGSVDPYVNLKMMNNGSFLANDSNMSRNLIQASGLATYSRNAPFSQIQDNPQAADTTFHNWKNSHLSKSHADHFQPKINQQMGSNIPNEGLLNSKVVGAGINPLKSDVLLNERTSSYNPGSGCNHCQSAGRCGSSKYGAGLRERMNQDIVDLNTFITSQLNTIKGQRQSASHGGSSNYLTGTSKLADIQYGLLGNCSGKFGEANVCFSGMAGAAFQDVDSSRKEEVGLSDVADQSAGHSMLSGNSGFQSAGVTQKTEYFPKKGEENDLCEVLGIPASIGKDSMPSSELISSVFNDFHGVNQLPAFENLFEDDYVKFSAGDDLFDVLGVHYKNKLLNGGGNKFHNGPGANIENQTKGVHGSMNLQGLGSDPYSNCERISESDIFSKSGCDDLLDAVVSGTRSAGKQSSDDNVSCRTTVTKISSSSVPSSSLTNGQPTMLDQMQKELFAFPKPAVRVGESAATSIRSACGKIDSRNCSQTSSVCGSQLSSWIEQGPSVKQDTSISTANSKKADEVCKSNRKRLKPGENPRPRPKDRQMIQDRMKELREIVPNGAKCSIDALLDRTIKHMLFLQSVTKHADKLKQMVESKIINEDGGLLLKDNFEGGATWAFEVGSQSMACPIVVEDLDPPRQLLVEMLCEERGFFLEIADMIRGLGLTILKGVMETRNDKLWARFAVEANRDVTRMEIFLPLVHLLEQAGRTLEHQPVAVKKTR
ncbi:hypothetical protein Ancab_007481 [Ancistrocladus abbreviatus]